MSEGKENMFFYLDNLNGTFSKQINCVLQNLCFKLKLNKLLITLKIVLKRLGSLLEYIFLLTITFFGKLLKNIFETFDKHINLHLAS